MVRLRQQLCRTSLPVRVVVGVARVRAEVASHGPAVPPQARRRPWWLARSAPRPAWRVRLAPSPRPAVASSVPAHQIAMPVSARRWHPCRNALYQLQRLEVQFVDLGTSHVTCGLTVLLGAAVDQGRALFAQTTHCKGWAGAIAQQPLQGGAVVCFDAHPRVHREPALPPRCRFIWSTMAQ